MTSKADRPILIVEDDIESRQGIVEILKGNGFERVVEASNGREALDYLIGPANAEPAVIVLDIGLPEMTGWELLVIIKAYHRLSLIPVLVLTGREVPSDAVKHGAISAIVTKPYEPTTFVAQVRAAMG
jgi:two-component system, OmpR family, response regulator